MKCSRNILLNTVAGNLQNQFRQQWKSVIKESSKCLTIRFLRQNIVSKSVSCLQTCINLRTSNNGLPIETGSWLRIERNERKCSKCDLNEIGDQFSLHV